MKASTVKPFLIGDILPHHACARKINDVARNNPAYAFDREIQRQQESSSQLSLGHNIFYEKRKSDAEVIPLEGQLLDHWYSSFDEDTTQHLAQLLYCHEVDILEGREPFKGLNITSSEARALSEILLALSREPVPQLLELPKLIRRDNAEIPIHVVKDPSIVFETMANSLRELSWRLRKQESLQEAAV